MQVINVSINPQIIAEPIHYISERERVRNINCMDNP